MDKQAEKRTLGFAYVVMMLAIATLAFIAPEQVVIALNMKAAGHGLDALGPLSTAVACWIIALFLAAVLYDAPRGSNSEPFADAYVVPAKRGKPARTWGTSTGFQPRVT